MSFSVKGIQTQISGSKLWKFSFVSSPCAGWLSLPWHLEKLSFESRHEVCGLGPSYVISHVLNASLLLCSHSHLEHRFHISVSISYPNLYWLYPGKGSNLNYFPTYVFVHVPLSNSLLNSLSSSPRAISSCSLQGSSACAQEQGGLQLLFSTSGHSIFTDGDFLLSLSSQPGLHSWIPFNPRFLSSPTWGFSMCCSTTLYTSALLSSPIPTVPLSASSRLGSGVGSRVFHFLICLFELKNIWEIFSQPQKNSLQTGGITDWIWNESRFVKERFYVSSKKHRRSSSKARYHWILYQQIENTCAFLLAGSHKIQYFCL